jgi:hypothetical protein
VESWKVTNERTYRKAQIKTRITKLRSKRNIAHYEGREFDKALIEAEIAQYEAEYKKLK